MFTLTAAALLVLASSSAAFPTSSVPDANASCPGGTSYVVKTGDTCTSVAAAANVSTLTFQTLNCLNAQCTDLQLGATVCLPAQCKTYIVQAGDTCDKISKANGITTPDFFKYNPGVISPGCPNINIGTNVCVDMPKGGEPQMPSCGPEDGQKPAQGTVAPGTDPACPKLHTAVSGDTCLQIVQLNNISLDDFYGMNPGVRNPDCSNLVPGAQYCVISPNKNCSNCG